MSVKLQKGQKAELTKGRSNIRKLLVGMGWRTGKNLDLDTAAFLLGENRRVAREEDFVFYGNLRHISGSVEHKGNNLTGDSSDIEQITINLSLVPENVKYIAITATIYDAKARRQNFGQVTGAYLRIADTETGQELLRYDLGDKFSVETAIIVGEIYRHKGEWKFNAVGGGYKGGLAALCNSFGIEVADEKNDAPPSEPIKPERQAESAVLRPGLVTVNLQKGQKISLEKRDGSGLKRVMVGLGWDPAPTDGGFIESLTDNIDCDASAFLCTDGYIADNSDIIYFGRLQHKSGAVKHMGDNLTGDGEGDDEQIFVDLLKLPRKYDKIVFVVNIFHFFKTKQHFGMIKNAFMRIVDEESGRELCRFALSDNYDGMKAVIFGELYRRENKWLFSPIGQGTTDDSVQELALHYTRRR